MTPAVSVEHVCKSAGRMVLQTKIGPGGATNTVIPGPNHYRGVAMANHIRPSEPRWHGSPDEWAANTIGWTSLAGNDTPLTLDRMDVEFPSYCAHGMALATMVFYTASDYNTVFSRPHPMILRNWAHLYGTHAHWMTLDVAESAVRNHFETSSDGRMLPADVIAEAKKLMGRADG